MARLLRTLLLLNIKSSLRKCQKNIRWHREIRAQLMCCRLLQLLKDKRLLWNQLRLYSRLEMLWTCWDLEIRLYHQQHHRDRLSSCYH